MNTTNTALEGLSDRILEMEPFTVVQECVFCHQSPEMYNSVDGFEGMSYLHQFLLHFMHLSLNFPQLLVRFASLLDDLLLLCDGLHQGIIVQNIIEESFVIIDHFHLIDIHLQHSADVVLQIAFQSDLVDSIIEEAHHRQCVGFGVEDILVGFDFVHRMLVE